jgi:hypothetical protein
MSDVRKKQQTEKALSRIKPGHWQNQWLYHEAIIHDGGDVRGPGIVLGEKKWPSAEIAEQIALEDLRDDELNGFFEPLEYLGPVFFPADKDDGA